MTFNPVVRFAVMSDLHYQEGSDFQRERFRKALETVYAYSENEEYNKLDALYIVGDFADTGHTEQIEMMGYDCKKYLKTGTELVVTIANHEMHYIPDMNVSIEDFKRVFNMDLDCHKVINGYHFISLSTTVDKGPWHDSFDAPKREFLKKQLEIAAADSGDKPIFVFQHPGQENTVAGGVYGNSEIYEILAQYPQVIDFSGHSHFPVNWSKEIHQKDFTSVSTGSLYNVTVTKLGAEFDELLFNPDECAHMLVVEADVFGEVHIKLLDVIAGRFFENAYIIKEANDKEKYMFTDKRAENAPIPYFNADAKGSIISEDSVAVVFPRAKCDGERVFGYRICLKESNDIVAEKKVISDFVEYYQKDEYTVSFDYIQSNTITAEVYAVGFWDNYSEPLIIK